MTKTIYAFGTIVLSIGVLFAQPANAACSGCEQLVSIEQEVKADKLQRIARTPEDAHRHVQLLRKASRAVGDLASSASKTLTREQVQQVLKLLIATNKIDVQNMVVENNFEIFEANLKVIESELRAMSKRDATTLKNSIYMVLGSDGQT